MRLTQIVTAFIKALSADKDFDLGAGTNEAQRIYIPLLRAKVENGGDAVYRAGHANRSTPARRHKPRLRGPSGFDLGKIKNPEKYLSSHARAMAGLKRALAA